MGGRHRQPPRSSPGTGRGSPQPAEGPLAAALARLRLLRSCCRFGAGDTGWAPAGARGWGQRLRSGSRRAARGLRATAGLVLRFLWMLFALLLLLLVLLLGVLRLCWRQGAAALAASRTWGLLGDSRLGRRLQDWTQKGVAAAAAAPGAAPGAGEEVTRLVAMAEVPEEELNPFEVLGVEATATDAELRRAYRRLAVLVRAWGRGGCLGVLSPPHQSTELRLFPPPSPRCTPTRASTRGRRQPSRCCGRPGTSSAAPSAGRSTSCERGPGQGGCRGQGVAAGV